MTGWEGAQLRKLLKTRTASGSLLNGRPLFLAHEHLDMRRTLE